MVLLVENWKTQIRKGYLELCILSLIRKHRKMYGFEILEKLSEVSLDVKEGTLIRCSIEWPRTDSWGRPGRRRT